MKKLVATLAFATVVLINGCQKDDYQEIVGLCPEVVSTSPIDGAVAVPLDANVTVTFNTVMDISTINQFSFKLSGPKLLTGTVSYSNLTATFNPTDLLSPNTIYTGTVTTFVKDITGNAMQENYQWSFVTGPSPINFNSASRFGVLSGIGISNVGYSEIWNMDIAVYNANRASITGFPPGNVVNGDIYAIDDAFPLGVAAMLATAKSDLFAAYDFAENLRSPNVVLLTGDQGGKTLIPGLYKVNNSLYIQNGDLTLNARGDTNAVWIFQIAGDLSTQGGAGGNIVLEEGARSRNIFWQTGVSATIGAGSTFHGTVIAANSIFINSNANIVGQLFARNGSVNMTSAIINKP